MPLMRFGWAVFIGGDCRQNIGWRTLTRGGYTESWKMRLREIQVVTHREADQFGARQSEAGAIRFALTRLGVTAPHTKEPYSDAMLFGLGGGIGVGYYTFDYSGFVSMYLNTRFMTQESAKPL